MPPRQSITKEMIIQAAFDLVRQNGTAALSARNIATHLSCSTQPVYSCFKNMKVLEDEVMEKSFCFILKKYLTGSSFSEDPFFSMGLGYTQLARKEPHLFDLIYLSDHTQHLFGSHLYPNKTAELIRTMQDDPQLQKLSKKTLKDILAHLWTYTHGLAMLARTNPELKDSVIHDRLHEMGRILICCKLNEQGITPDETVCD
jgi:AcrR family transcriptional regulator